MSTLVRPVPWLAALVPMIALSQTIIGLIAGVVWIAIIASLRIAGRGRDRAARMRLDLVLLLGCVAAFVLGGLYFAPAAAAFWLLDRSGPDRAEGVDASPLVASKRPPSLYLGLVSCAVGFAGIAAFLLLPTYTSASSTSTNPGVTTMTGSSALQIGLDPQAIVALALIAALFAVVGMGSLITTRSHRSSRALVGSAVLGLLIATVVGGFSIGLFIALGALLAFVAFTLSLGETVSEDPSSSATSKAG